MVPTVQVCVSRCPQEDYTPLGSSVTGVEAESVIKERIKQFCSPDLSTEILTRYSVRELVAI